MIKKINRFIENILFALLATIMVIVFVQVVLRFFSISVIWVEELSRFMFIWMVFLGAAIGINHRIHLNVDYFIAKSKKPLKFVILWIDGILQIILIAVLLIYGLKLVPIWMDSTSPVLGIPVILVYSALPVSALIMIINTIYIIKKDIIALKERGQ